jgi:hypothetical protein
MTSPRTIHSRLHKAGLVPVKDTWLTPEQAAQVKAWDDQNRKTADVARNTHKETKQ